MLDKHDLKLGSVKYAKAPENAALDTVIAQQPAAGDEIVKGESVNIVLAAPPETGFVPEVNGRSLAAGRRGDQGRALRHQPGTGQRRRRLGRHPPAPDPWHRARNRGADHARGQGAADPDPDPDPDADRDRDADVVRDPLADRDRRGEAEIERQEEGQERRGEDRERPEGAGAVAPVGLRLRRRDQRPALPPGQPGREARAADLAQAPVRDADDDRRRLRGRAGHRRRPPPGADLRRRQDGRHDRRG